jgi:hypothetical protein
MLGEEQETLAKYENQLENHEWPSSAAEVGV